MPIIEITSPRRHPPAGLLDDLCGAVTQLLGLPPGHAWAIWRSVEDYSRPEWAGGDLGPIVFVRCKSHYSRDQIGRMVHTIQRALAQGLDCQADTIYVAVQRIAPHELLVRGEIWRGEEARYEDPVSA
jgi:phenylpyruvate tautomerase PptA (4-oxalocrotonate tautomerase family)